MKKCNRRGFLSPLMLILLLLVAGVGVIGYAVWPQIQERVGTGTGLAVVKVSEQTQLETTDVAATAISGKVSGGDLTAQDLKCLGVDQVAWTPTFREKWNPKTSALDQFAYKINGVETSSTAEPETAINVPPYSDIEILYHSNYSSGAISNVSWLSVIDKFKAPCEKFTSITEVPDVDEAMLTWKFTNSYDGLRNSDSQQDTIAAGNVKSIDLTISGKYEDQFGATKMLVCVEYNNTGAWDEIIPSVGTKAGKPDRLTTGSGSTEPCYEFSALESNADLPITWTFDADDDYFGIDSGNVTFTAVPDAGFRDDATNYLYGYETDKNAKVGSSDETGTFYLK